MSGYKVEGGDVGVGRAFIFSLSLRSLKEERRAGYTV